MSIWIVIFPLAWVALSILALVVFGAVHYLAVRAEEREQQQADRAFLENLGARF